MYNQKRRLRVYVLSDFIHHVTFWPTFVTVFVMKDDGSAIVRVSVFFDNHEVSIISDLSVTPKLRNQGLGSKLLSIGEDVGRILGARSCRLACDGGQSDWRPDWYQRRGYERDGSTEWLVKTIK